MMEVTIGNIEVELNPKKRITSHIDIINILESREVAINQLFVEATENKTLKPYEMDTLNGRLQELRSLRKIIAGHKIAEEIMEMQNGRT